MCISEEKPSNSKKSGSSSLMCSILVFTVICCGYMVGIMIVSMCLLCPKENETLYRIEGSPEGIPPACNWETCMPARVAFVSR
jgi:hypothetical protein